MDSSPQLASMHATNPGFSQDDFFNLKSSVPFNYLATLFIAFQSRSLGELTFLLKILTAAAISDLVVLLK